MLIHELTLAECHAVLARTTLGRLACARDDQPYIVPVFVYFDPAEDCLYSFSTVGQKIDWMRRNPRVCIEVDDISDQFHWKTVLIFGRYEEISNLGDQNAVRRRAEELFQRHADWWLPGVGKLTRGEEHGEPVVYRVGIDRMSGRQAARGPG